jgi:CCR4-NOT transcription complex subunit 6
MFKKRQEGAILALLRHRASKRQLLAACTHLFW